MRSSKHHSKLNFLTCQPTLCEVTCRTTQQSLTENPHFNSQNSCLKSKPREPIGLKPGPGESSEVKFNFQSQSNVKEANIY